MSEYCKKCGQDLYGESKFMEVDIPFCHDCAFHKLAKEWAEAEEKNGNEFIDTDGRKIEATEWVEWFMVEEIENELDKTEYLADFD